MVHSDAVKCSTVIVAKRIECVQVGPGRVLAGIQSGGSVREKIN